jgi:hypothetical protein
VKQSWSVVDADLPQKPNKSIYANLTIVADHHGEIITSAIALVIAESRHRKVQSPTVRQFGSTTSQDGSTALIIIQMLR